MRTIFAQANREAAGQQLQVVVVALVPRWPKSSEALADVEDELLACMAFPPFHWTRVYSTNPLERVNKETPRRTNFVGVFPDDPSVLRLVGTIRKEIDDEWQGRRRYFSHESMRQLTEPTVDDLLSPTPFTLSPVKQHRGREAPANSRHIDRRSSREPVRPSARPEQTPIPQAYRKRSWVDQSSGSRSKPTGTAD